MKISLERRSFTLRRNVSFSFARHVSRIPQQFLLPNDYYFKEHLENVNLGKISKLWFIEIVKLMFEGGRRPVHNFCQFA